MNKLLLIISIFASITVKAQTAEIYGNIKDDMGHPIIGTNLLIESTLLGTATDSEGNYKILNIPKGSYIITASIVGYEKQSKKINLAGNDKIEVNFMLSTKSYQFDQLVITANKYAKDIREVAASSYVLDQRIFSEKNIKQIDDALRYVPGVTMVADQISIRGSSGYGRGAGTRVLVAIDGIPIYSPDSGDIVWELVPISEIGRVEIIKGSVSSLYGSSAIGGVINVISKEISSNPVTYLKIQSGLYSKPSHKEWEWTDRTLSFNSQTISHSRSIGKLSLSGSITRFEDYSYRQNDFQLRFGGFLKANYQFSESTSLAMIGTGYTRDKETYNYWKDISHALSPPDEDIGQTTDSDRTILGFTLNHIFNKNFSMTFIPSAYISFWKDDSESKNKSSSRLLRNELRTNYNYNDKFNLVSGTEFQFNTASSNIFGNNTSKGIGVYSQADYKPISPLNISIGLRYDYSKLENIESTQSISPKLGITYQYSEKTFFRGLISKGFRAPSLAEAFTSTTSAGITVKPNPNIKSETSYSIELGVNHIISDLLSVDVSLFNNEYFEMIEPGFDPDDGQVFFNNVTRARIQGAEITGIYSPLSNININIGYTYLWPRDIEKDKSLNYRPKHTVLVGLDFTKNLYQFGIDLRYLSRVDEIDNELVDLGVIVDGDNRVNIFVLDINAGLNLFSYNLPLRLFLNANNLLNYNYVELIGNISPIRNYSLNLELIF